METTFTFDEYSVTITEYSITYSKNNNNLRVSSNFRNQYDEQTGEIIIENIYMRFNCIFPHEIKQMFDFISRGFQIDFDKLGSSHP